MMNCCCGMFDRQKAYSLISSRDHCQRSLPLQFSDTLRPEFRFLVKWSHTVVITATPRRHIERIPVNSLFCAVMSENPTVRALELHIKFGWHLPGRTFVSVISKWTHSLNLTYIEILHVYLAFFQSRPCVRLKKYNFSITFDSNKVVHNSVLRI